MPESKFIEGCVNRDANIQNLVYKTYAPKVFGICKRYMKDRERAEEMALNCFLTVFQKIEQYKNQGSFEGWILRIAVNCCLMELRKRTIFSDAPIENSLTVNNEATTNFESDDIERILAILPDGARIVFNLYAIEGYKHEEIAKQLGISVGTSKSQLHYAKEKLKNTFFNHLQKSSAP